MKYNWKQSKLDLGNMLHKAFIAKAIVFDSRYLIPFQDIQ